MWAHSHSANTVSYRFTPHARCILPCLVTFADSFWTGYAAIKQHRGSFSFLFTKGFCPHGCREKLRAFGEYLQAAQRADRECSITMISHHKLWLDASYLQQITHTANSERLVLADGAALCDPDPRSKHPEASA